MAIILVGGPEAPSVTTGTNSRKAIRQEVARQLQGPYRLEFTASTNATTNLVILSNFTSTHLADTLFAGAFVYVSYDAGGANAAPEGEYKRIASYVASTGTFTMDNAFTAAVTANDKVEIHTKMEPSVIHECIDRGLRKMLYPTLAVPSLMADADMESSVTTAYTAGTGATLAKDSTNVFRGTQSLRITADATGNRYAYQRFSVTPGDSYYLFGVCQNSAIATTCKLQAYDVTNGAEIDSKTSSQLVWGGLGFQFTIPTSCEQIDVRLITVTANGISYWDHVGLYQANARRYALPSWVTEKWQVGRLVYQLAGSELVADTSVMDTTAPTRWEHIRVKKEGATVYVVPDPPFNHIGPIYLECLRPYAALATDSATTNADLDWVVAKTKVECLRLLKGAAASAEERRIADADLAEAEQAAAALDRHFMPKFEQAWGFGEEALWSPRVI